MFFYCVLDQMHAALVRISDFENIKTSYKPKTFVYICLNVWKSPISQVFIHIFMQILGCHIKNAGCKH